MAYPKIITRRLSFPIPVLSMILVLLIHTTAAAYTKIELFETSTVDKAVILLGEIGRISGDNPLKVQQVEDVFLGNAPLPAKKKTIDRDQVVYRLKQQGIDLSTTRIVMPEETEITRRFKKISVDEIEKIILAFLDKNLPWDKTLVTIKDIQINNEPILPTGSITYKVVPPPKADYLGLTPFSVDFSVNGKFEKRSWVTLNIEVMAEVVVTRKPLGRFKLIDENDICLKKKNLAKLPSNVITCSEEVLGKRTRRSIDSNVTLRPDHVELPPLVKRGDIVKIIVESQGLKVTALGKVQGKGRRGEMIKVINVDSSKAIYARVLDASNVKVEY